MLNDRINRHNSREFLVAWEEVDHPGAEDRVLAAFELLLAPAQSAAGFDKASESSQDECKAQVDHFPT
jgi:hypothetical protein